MNLQSEVIRILNAWLAGAKKISQLPAAGTLDGSELYEAVQGGVNVKVLGSNIGTGGGGSEDLQDVLDNGSAAVVTTDVEIERTGEFVFELLSTGINISHLDDPVVISSGEVASGGRIDLNRDSALRIQISTHNDHYSTGGTSHHRFFAPGVGAQVRLMEASGNGSNYIGLKAPDDVTTAQVYTFPAAGPASNGQVLASQTDGTLSWTTPATGGADEDFTLVYALRNTFNY